MHIFAFSFDFTPLSDLTELTWTFVTNMRFAGRLCNRKTSNMKSRVKLNDANCYRFAGLLPEAKT